jgi:hypothetical protein
MRRILLALLLCASTSACLAADPPSYLVLRQTPPTFVQPTAQGFAVETPTYNYGWFGAKYGRTWQRSFGYHRAYTQWKVR